METGYVDFTVLKIEVTYTRESGIVLSTWVCRCGKRTITIIQVELNAYGLSEWFIAVNYLGQRDCMKGSCHSPILLSVAEQLLRGLIGSKASTSSHVT